MVAVTASASAAAWASVSGTVVTNVNHARCRRRPWRPRSSGRAFRDRRARGRPLRHWSRPGLRCGTHPTAVSPACLTRMPTNRATAPPTWTVGNGRGGPLASPARRPRAGPHQHRRSARHCARVSGSWRPSVARAGGPPGRAAGALGDAPGAGWRRAARDPVRGVRRSRPGGSRCHARPRRSRRVNLRRATSHSSRRRAPTVPLPPCTRTWYTARETDGGDAPCSLGARPSAPHPDRS
jgi:hypothetical protein